MMAHTRPRTQTPPAQGAPAPVPARPRMAAGRVLVAMLVCFLVWGLLDAQSLERSAEASPLGIRRTVALGVLRPLSGLSGILGIREVADLMERALGRDPNAAPGGGGLPGFGAGVNVPPVDAPLPGPPSPPAPRGSTGPGVEPTNSPIPPAAQLPPLRRPSPAHPLRILVVGDSLAGDLGYGLERTVSSSLYRISLDGRPSTGLTRADYFDWAAQTKRDVARYHPELVVAMFGANDNQSLAVPGKGWVYMWHAAQWAAAYRIRVAQIMHEATAGGARMAWVGIPITRSSVMPNGRALQLNGIFSSEALHHRGVLFVDSWHQFAPDGHYSPYLENSNGHVQLMREPDGVHMTPAGNDFLAQSMEGTLGRVWGFRG